MSTVSWLTICLGSISVAIADPGIASTLWLVAKIFGKLVMSNG